jgi:hypothetical protein
LHPGSKPPDASVALVAMIQLFGGNMVYDSPLVNGLAFRPCRPSSRRTRRQSTSRA